MLNIVQVSATPSTLTTWRSRRGRRGKRRQTGHKNRADLGGAIWLALCFSRARNADCSGKTAPSPQARDVRATGALTAEAMSRRHEQHSTIISTNLAFKQWGNTSPAPRAWSRSSIVSRSTAIASRSSASRGATSTASIRTAAEAEPITTQAGVTGRPSDHDGNHPPLTKAPRFALEERDRWARRWCRCVRSAARATRQTRAPVVRRRKKQKP